MENTSKKSLSDSILEFTKSASNDIGDKASATSKAVSSTASSVTSAVSSSGESKLGFFGWLKSINIIVWILLILILAFLGFNIFTYLSKGTNAINSIFAPFLEKIFGTTVATTTQTIDVAAEGGKAVVSGTATGINTGLTAVQSVTPTTAPSSIPSNSVETHEETQEAENSLNKALNSQKSDANNDYQPHEASSSVHASGKAGWCFIGDDKGVRTCGKVGANDTCMSGDIFPTQELCVNPNLRA